MVKGSHDSRREINWKPQLLNDGLHRSGAFGRTFGCALEVGKHPLASTRRIKQSRQHRCAHDEARRHRQAKSCHLREAGALAARLIRVLAVLLFEPEDR
jgi:hypothetical protein